MSSASWVRTPALLSGVDPRGQFPDWHAFSGSDRIRFGSSAPIESSFGETALEVGAGIAARVNQTTSVYAHADYRWSLGGDSRQTATQGTIGIRFNW